MAPSASRPGSELELATGRVFLRLDPATLAMELDSPEDVVLAGFLPQAVVGGRIVRAARPLSQREEVGEDGAEHRVAICGSDAGLEFALDVAAKAGETGVVLSLAVTNRSNAPLAIDALDPLAWSASVGRLALPGDAERVRFYRMGFQSWSPAGFVAIRDREPAPRVKLVHTMHLSPHAPVAQAGLHASDFATVLRAPGEAGLTVGFTTHHRFLNHVELRHLGAHPIDLVARVPCEGRVLAPGETLRAERLWLSIDPPEQDGLAVWAERTGEAMRALVPERVGAGWCSWYQYFTKVSAGHVRANTATLAKLDAGIETVQIDDGFQAAIGDWLEWDDDFPDGIAPLAQEIRASGFRAGLWLAPYLVSSASRIAEAHPDWLLRAPSGRPRVGNVNPSWKGRTCHVLDPTHPEVREWLAEVTSTVRGWGFDYLKLDFLYAGTLGGVRHDAGAGSAEAYRSGIEAMRSAAPDAFLLGCGAPLGPSVGLFEGMRIGADVAPSWRARAQDTAMGLPAAPSAENSLRNILLRAPLHNRLWANDPDCVLLRDSDTKLSDAEVKTLAGAVACSGGMLVVSDDLANLSEERRTLLRRLVPALGRAAEVGPADREIPERLLQRWPDGSALLFWVNLEEKVRIPEVDLDGLGFAGSVHVFDVWGARPLGVHRDRVTAGEIEPRASLLWRLVPVDGEPRVLGTTLHVGAGALEVRAAEPRGDGGVGLELALPGSRQGRVWVAPPGREPVCLGVGFRDAVALEVGSEGVPLEDSADMPDS